jgi:glycosyltransferase involved in cell wall biosynthesis
MLRIRDEERWISDAIESILPLCERVFVLDDHSQDRTAEICKGFDRVTVYPSPFAGLDEARDKNWLAERVRAACDPDWIVCIDGDEVLVPGGAEIIRETVVETESCHAYAFRIAFLWNDENTVRTDRIYGSFWRPSLFAPYHGRDELIINELKFLSTPFGRRSGNNSPNLHCSSVPQRFIHGHGRCPAVLLHYGYMHRADRVRKLDYYTSIDWLNRAEDSYRHMTQGDNVTLTELPRTQDLVRRGVISMQDVKYMLDTPADASLVHAGPLQLEKLCELA